jgi:hypothetical protein
MNIRINADDFGISPGVNFAIEKCFLEKKLHSASVIYGCGYLAPALEIAKRNPDLKIGLHFNLSSGVAAFKHAQPALLVDENNKFKNGFLKILLLSIFKKQQLQNEVEKELIAQCALIEKVGISLNHFDSHRHIHSIPAVFSVVLKIAREKKITKIRIINEEFFRSLKISESKNFLLSGGIIKWLVLRSLWLCNDISNLKPEYFFSIINTCAISEKLISKIKVPKNFTELEIMLHPGNPEIDRDIENLEEKNHLLSENRIIENFAILR